MEIIKPTAIMQKWADAEIGVIIHLDLQVFDSEYKTKYGLKDSSGLSLFNPEALDTDQWIKSAKAAGATYAILTAKHGTGFTLHPSDANDYHVGNTPYKNGSGDVVAEFIASCKKYGIKPGLYYSTSYNWYYQVFGGRAKSGSEADQKEYNDIVIKQVTELWSRYGELFEIWFDGGCLPPEDGGPDLVPILNKYQPNAVTFQSPAGIDNGIRWCGNERAEASYDCWATVMGTPEAFDGLSEHDQSGNAYGDLWRPAESDTPGRIASKSFEGGWIWKKGEDHAVFKAEELFEKYISSVGRNTNLLIGVVIDNRGLVPDADKKELEELGNLIKEQFGTPVATYSKNLSELKYTLKTKDGIFAKYLVVMEDISEGERVTKFHLDCGIEGKCIGHKRIIPLPESTSEVTLYIDEFKDTPKLRKIELY